jgi:hypothetical protein
MNKGKSKLIWFLLNNLKFEYHEKFSFCSGDHLVDHLLCRD